MTDIDMVCLECGCLWSEHRLDDERGRALCPSLFRSDLPRFGIEQGLVDPPRSTS